MPWLVLVVVEEREGVTLTDDAGGPVLSVDDAARAARADRGVGLGACADRHAESTTSDALLADSPESRRRGCCARAISSPDTPYLACLVPSFEAGRLAGLGTRPARRLGALAWTAASGALRLPVYHSWRFRTAPQARRLRGAGAPPRPSRSRPTSACMRSTCPTRARRICPRRRSWSASKARWCRPRSSCRPGSNPARDSSSRRWPPCSPTPRPASRVPPARPTIQPPRSGGRAAALRRAAGGIDACRHRASPSPEAPRLAVRGQSRPQAPLGRRPRRARWCGATRSG